jgi:hypothetical protein
MENILMAARGWGREEWGVIAHGNWVSFVAMKMF